MSFPDLGSKPTSITHVETRRDRPSPHLGRRRSGCRHRPSREQRVEPGSTDCLVRTVLERCAEESIRPLLGKLTGLGKHDRH